MGIVAEHFIKIIKDNELLEFLFHVGNGWCKLDYNEEEFKDPKEYLSSLGLNDYKQIESREDTSEFWSIIHFKNEDIYLKINGEYDSYGQEEHYYHSVTEVLPKEITTIIYE